MTRLLVTDAIIRARKLDVIARANEARTRLWFYRGDEEMQNTWVQCSEPADINGATISLEDFERATR